MKIVKETENLYRLTRLGMVNCFLVRDEDGLVLIDTNLPGTARAILRAAEKLGSRICKIILTHAHFDHTGSVDEIMVALPGIELLIGERERRLLAGDFTLEPGESGKKLLGFPRIRSKPTQCLNDGDRIGPLEAISTPGHTPGHMTFRDTRDNSLIAGDAFVNQKGLMAAGEFSVWFPLPAWFSWNGAMSAESTARIGSLKPSLLCVGHGKSLVSPQEKLDRAIARAFQQHPRRKQG